MRLYLKTTLIGLWCIKFVLHNPKLNLTFDAELNFAGICEHTLHHADMMSNLAVEAHAVQEQNQSQSEPWSNEDGTQPNTVFERELSMHSVGVSPDQTQFETEHWEHDSVEEWYGAEEEDFVNDGDEGMTTPIFT